MNSDGTNAHPVYETKRGNTILEFFWSKNSDGIQFLENELFVGNSTYEYDYNTNNVKTITSSEYRNDVEIINDRYTFSRPKSFLSFDLNFLPKTTSKLSLSSENNSVKAIITDVSSSRVIKEFQDNYGELGPISSDGNYFLYKPGNGSSIERGIEMYSMNGNLVGRTPYHNGEDFIGFIQK